MKNTIINAKVEKLNELTKVLSIKREFGIRNAKNKVNEQNLNRPIFSIKDSITSYNTIDNWVRKCGLDEINQTPKALNDNNYAMIIDECMMIGSQKLLTMISVPAEHQGRPLQLDDARGVGLKSKLLGTPRK